jgi:hypothetical protein
MEVLYTMDEDTSEPSSSPQEADTNIPEKMQPRRHRRTLRWPFSLEVYETMDVARWPAVEEAQRSPSTKVEPAIASPADTSRPLTAGAEGSSSLAATSGLVVLDRVDTSESPNVSMHLFCFPLSKKIIPSPKNIISKQTSTKIEANPSLVQRPR